MLALATRKNLLRKPMSLRRTAIASLVVLTGLLGLGTELTFAADLAVIPRHTGHPHPGADISKSVTSTPETGTRLEEFATGPNANCTAWTDGCRSCGKGPEGVFCSNIGIACQPSPTRCSRH
jgi:hypothetical protein